MSTLSAVKEESFEAAVDFASRQFAVGFIAGQLSFGLLLLILVRVFFLRNGNEALADIKKKRRPSQRLLVQKKVAKSSPNDVASTSGPLESGSSPRKLTNMSTTSVKSSSGGFSTFLLSLSDAVILEKAYCPSLVYNKSSVESPDGRDSALGVLETCGWINLLLVQTLSVFRNDPLFQNKLLGEIDGRLNGPQKPSFVAPIMVSDLVLGSEYPKLLGATLRELPNVAEPADPHSLCVEINFEYEDTVSLSLESQILLNWPRQVSASLPVTLTVHVTGISGSFIIKHNLPGRLNPLDSWTDPNSREYKDSSITFFVAPDTFSMDIKIQSMLGNRTKVKDLPHMNAYIASKIEEAVIESIITPLKKRIFIPNLFDNQSISD